MFFAAVPKDKGVAISIRICRTPPLSDRLNFLLFFQVVFEEFDRITECWTIHATGGELSPIDFYKNRTRYDNFADIYDQDVWDFTILKWTQ